MVLEYQREARKNTWEAVKVAGLIYETHLCKCTGEKIKEHLFPGGHKKSDPVACHYDFVMTIFSRDSMIIAILTCYFFRQ
jgi:hypothetical protein